MDGEHKSTASADPCLGPGRKCFVMPEAGFLACRSQLVFSRHPHVALSKVIRDEGDLNILLTLHKHEAAVQRFGDGPWHRFQKVVKLDRCRGQAESFTETHIRPKERTRCNKIIILYALKVSRNRKHWNRQVGREWMWKKQMFHLYT